MIKIVISDILSIEQYLLNLLITHIVFLLNTTCIVIVIDTILISTHNYIHLHCAQLKVIIIYCITKTQFAAFIQYIMMELLSVWSML